MKTDDSADTVVDQYMTELNQALSPLPDERREEILAEITHHIEEGRALLDEDDTRSVGALLDRIGAPSAIAAEAGAWPLSAKTRRGDSSVPWILLFGGLAGIIAWPLAALWLIGVWRLWRSPEWRFAEKIVGTLLLPGGLLSFGLLVFRPAAVTSCSGHGGPGIRTVTHCVTSGLVLSPALAIPVVLLAVAIPVFTTTRLLRTQRAPLQ
jgi:hypothetical protein